MSDRGAAARRLAFTLPALALLLAAAAPLLLGLRTLTLRDVLNTHFALRASLGAALRAGEMPLIDPLRSGGEALAGNANAVPFYPDNLLLLVVSDLWQLNLHFALHWIIAFVSACWLGRAWGLEREGAGAAAAVFAFSGYWFSQMNFYNAVAVVALAPALWAALLEAGEAAKRRRSLLAAGLLWALMVLGGDPTVAAIAAGGGLVLAAARHGKTLPWRRVLLALALGTLVAAPQIVETVRILPGTFRAVQGTADTITGIRDPRAVVDLLIPLFFGRPDLGAVWGKSLFGGRPPIYFSLAPGAVALLLAGAAGWPRRREARALALLAVAGFALAFSGGTPLPRWLGRLPGAELFRFWEKFFLLAALALALAAGHATERLVRGEGRRRAAAVLGALLATAFALWMAFGVPSLGAEKGFVAFFGGHLESATWSESRLRWAGLSMYVVATLLLAALALALARRRAAAAAAALLALHAGSQLHFLRPLLASDARDFYETPPPIAAQLAPDAVLAQGMVGEIFGKDDLTSLFGKMPGREHQWLERNAWTEFYSFASLSAGRRHEFAISPEGLDSFVTMALANGMSTFDDPTRIAILRATGVDLLLLARPLVPEGIAGTRLRATVPSLGRVMYIHELTGSLPEVTLAGTILRAPHVNAGLDAVRSPGFDPATTAVIPGSGAPVRAESGSARLVRSERERVEVEVDSPSGGVLILRRAYLPIWRATVDGVRAPTRIAQLTRLAVEVPPGRHRVELWISRVPLRVSVAVSLLALATLAALFRLDRRRELRP